MIKQLISSIILIWGAIGAGAVEYTVTAGQLASLVESPQNVSMLKLNGSVNAFDLDFISTNMPALNSLDLTDVTAIEACSGKLIGNVSQHPANTIPANMFAGMGISSLTLPLFDGLVINSGAFAGTSLGGLSIPANTAFVGDGCFAGCPYLKTVTCGASVIGVGAFSNCSELISFTVTKPTVIPENCFNNCSNLLVIIADKASGAAITSVGDGALAGCVSLSSFPFDSGLTHIGSRAFMNAGLSGVDLSGCTALESIGEWAFARMPNLTKLDMGHVEKIGEGVAFACPKLTSISSGQNVSAIPDFAFSKSSKVAADGLLPVAADTIGRYALSGLNEIKEITLPSSLRMLDDHAMENMTSLFQIIAPIENVPELGEDVWSGVDQKNVALVVPVNSENQYREAEQWSEFNIVNTPLGAEETTDRGPLDSDIFGKLKGRFDGDNLILFSDGADVSVFCLYNVAGILLATAVPEGDLTVIDTSSMNTNIFIVQAVLADGRQAVLKISKH